MFIYLTVACDHFKSRKWSPDTHTTFG